MMVDRKSIEEFLSQKKLAVIGVSRDTKQFANAAFRLLKERGYTVYPINPYVERVENDRCYPNIKSLSEHVGGALVLLPPEKTMKVLTDIAEVGIKHVWLQQQTESPQAIQFCRDHRINVVYGECIIMFTEPLEFPHRLHRWVKKVTRTLPT
jgi:uncharacterized protein